MHPYPHHYTTFAQGSASGSVVVSAQGLPDIQTAPPPEFDGPGGVWSPETLFCAALADCFILTFRAVSRASQLPWSTLQCSVEGILERVDRQSQFTKFITRAQLVVPAGSDVAKAKKLLEQSEHGCLIANSLRGTRSIEVQVSVAPQ